MKLKVIFFISEIVSKGINFSILILLPFIISAEVYGDLALAWTIDLILVELIGFGQTHFIIRNYSEVVDRNLLIVNSILIIFTGAVVSLLFSSIFEISQSSVSMALLITSSAFQAIVNIVTTEYRVTDQVIAYSKLRLVSSLGKFLIYFLVSYNYNLFSNISIIYYLLIVFSIIIIGVKVLRRIKVVIWSVQSFLIQYKQTASVFLHVVAGILLVSADKLIAPHFFTIDMVGKYIFNLQLVGGSFIAVNLISIWILPRAFIKQSRTKRYLVSFLSWGLAVTVVYNLLFHFVGIWIIGLFRPYYVLPFDSYYALYLITILVVFQNYLYYLFLWRNKVYLEAFWTTIVSLIIALSYRFWNVLDLYDLLKYVILYNLLMILGAIALYRYVSKGGLHFIR